MSGSAGHYTGREKAIANLLWYGTWVASAVIFLGMVLKLEPTSFAFGLHGFAIVKAGVALLILLPVARVTLMLFIFLREQDYAFTMICTLVVVIIATSFFLGL